MSKKTAHRSPYLLRFSLLGVVVILLAGAGALLFDGAAHTRPASAARTGYDDLSVVGPPSLPAATVNTIFARLGSPMSGTGAVVEQVSQQTQIDDAFALAVWWTETNDGAAGVGLADRNPGSVRGSVGYPSAYDGYTIYPTYTDAITYWFHMLRNLYVDRGLSTVYAISHPYVGTSSSPLWAGKVIALMLRYRGEVPPPTPVPTIVPSPTFAPGLPHHQRAAPFDAAAQTPSAGSAQPLAQQGALADSVQTVTALPRSIATWLIVLSALVMALAIALWARRLPLKVALARPAQGRIQVVQNYAPAWQAGVQIMHDQPGSPYQPGPPDAHKGVQAMYDHPGPPDAHEGHPYISANPHIHPVGPLRLPARTVAAFEANPATADLFVRLPETPGVGKMRRVVLLPARQNDEAGEVGEGNGGAIRTRPAGLLARYGPPS